MPMKPSEQQQIDLLTEIKGLLRRIERNTRPVRPLAKTFVYETFKLTSDGRIRTDEMNLLLNENAEIDVTGIKDAGGNAAAIEGDKVNWSVSGESDLGELKVSEDTKSAVFVRNGKAGTCTVEFRGDADLGPDEDNIVGMVELVCLGGKAVKFEFEAKAIPA